MKGWIFMNATKEETWINTRIREDQKTRYMNAGKDFIDDGAIYATLERNVKPDASRIRDIIAKSCSIQTLTADETAALINVRDPKLVLEMEAAALSIKNKVYDNRIVTFAPLYMSSRCVNNCTYCGFRKDNHAMKRGVLSQDEVRKETEVMAGSIGHKRIIAVYGEHPSSDVNYIAETMRTIYSVKTKTHKGTGSIRRINVNAAPMSIEELEILHKEGLGTYQVFQETYHHKTYAAVHPANTIKADFPWRLYSMHRAMEAGIDDVGIGALFGLADWKFEVMGLVSHAVELEKKYNIGPHTISFPRIEPAQNSILSEDPSKKTSDEDFRRAVVVLRLAVPYTGMIVTARETAKIRNDLFRLGVTQADASTRIGIGSYSDISTDKQLGNRQQFILGDTRSLDELVRDLADMGNITSFCTAGYRCGRTGKCIMDLLRTGKEGKFCKLNAVITFREWLDDFASPDTKAAGEKIIEKEIEEIRNNLPGVFDEFFKQYDLTKKGERDLYF
ncbi:MAG TPA: [FeFe] hydrogenase H-cluster radical SAM maturase HydG [Fibrobacteres bacterium]|jgi:2-iminoacetate synthase|nr:[FeFe] hydrogenase H-cluster radical SAM maturase HydG [Fibrobacterota bacterium]